MLEHTREMDLWYYAGGVSAGFMAAGVAQQLGFRFVTPGLLGVIGFVGFVIVCARFYMATRPGSEADPA